MQSLFDAVQMTVMLTAEKAEPFIIIEFKADLLIPDSFAQATFSSDFICCGRLPV